MSLVFSGTQYNTISTTTGGDDFTAMVRVMISPVYASSTFDIISEYDGSRNSFRLYWSNGKFITSITNSSVFIIFVTYNTLTVTNPSTSPTDTWTHLAVAFQNKTLTLYVDGDAVASGSHNNSNMDPTSNTLGAQRTGTNSYTSYFKGEMEDLRIYSPTLAPEYIKNIAMHKGVDQIIMDQVGRWNFTGPTGVAMGPPVNLVDSIQGSNTSTTINYG